MSERNLVPKVRITRTKVEVISFTEPERVRAETERVVVRFPPVYLMFSDGNAKNDVAAALNDLKLNLGL